MSNLATCERKTQARCYEHWAWVVKELSVSSIPRSIINVKELKMPAFTMDNGRHADANLIREGVEAGEYQPVTAKVTMSHTAVSTETAEERRLRYARETGTRRGMWK